MKHRTPTKRSKYYTEPRAYKHAMSWCLCYPLWIKELETLPDPGKAIDYSKDRVQTSAQYDSTSELALKRVALESKVNLLETTAGSVAGDLAKWLIKGVTEDIRSDDLITQGMPCGKTLYYEMRQKFYYMISKRI